MGTVLVACHLISQTSTSAHVQTRMPTLHVPAGSTDHLQSIADALWKAKKVVVITGAGISTNSGIPVSTCSIHRRVFETPDSLLTREKQDFRSENGLYSMIQGQFDAATRLGGGKPQAEAAQIDDITPDDRPRKRRKTTPPVEDSIEVITTSLDIEEPSETSANTDTIIVNGVQTSENRVTCADAAQSNRDDAAPKDEMEPSATAIKVRTRAESGNSRDQTKDDNELMAPKSTAADNLDSLDDRGVEETIAQEEPTSVSSKSSEEDKTQEVKAIRSALSGGRRKRRAPALDECIGTAADGSKPLDGDSAIRPYTVPEHAKPRISGTTTASTSNPSTPRQRALKSLHQTSASSPLSSPPSHLSDVFDDQSVDPPPSSSRPSSPVSDGEDSGAGENEEGDNQQAWSQEHFNRASTFKRSLSTLKGRELFDASIWADPLKTSVFYTFATNLRQKSRDASPTGCHHFISHLSKAGKMVRCYTQNIDLLEDKVGLSTRLLLGPGSRGRFSAKVAKNLAASVASRALNNTNNQQAPATPVPTPTASQETSQTVTDGPVLSQEASEIGRQQSTLSRDDKPGTETQDLSNGNSQVDERKGNSTLEGERQDSAGPEKDGATADAQPADASSPAADKPPAQVESGTATPEPNKGVECVFLHGSLRALRCFQCGCVADWDEGDRELQTMSGQQPPCPRCEHATVARQERGKRALGVGKLRPDIVLYGEEHPESQRISTIIQHDIALAPDMLIVMGTSLKVHGLKTVVREFAKTVHNRKDGKVIFVNYTKPADSVWADVFDFWIEMDCDAWVEDLKEKKPIMWLPPGSVEEESKPARKRRPVKDEADKKDNKRPKKSEEEAPKLQVDIPAAVVADEQSKKPDKEAELEKLKEEEPSVSKKSVPKRPAAFRDCRQNAAYWVTKIRADLAKISGRKLEPDSLSRPALISTAIFAAPPPVTTVPTGRSPLSAESAKPKRRPRTKNTKSRLDSQEPNKAVQQAPTKQPSYTRAPAKTKANAKNKKERRQGPLTYTVRIETPVPIPQPLAFRREPNVAPSLIKQEGNKHSPHNPEILSEVPVPNTSLNTTGESNSIVNAVKSNHRIRKPKAIFGDVYPSDHLSKRETSASNSKVKMGKIGPSAKRGKASPHGDAASQAQTTTAGVDMTGKVMLPIPTPQTQHLSAAAAAVCSEPQTPVERIVLAPLRTVHHGRRNSSFLQLTLGPSQQSHGPGPVTAPSYLEPSISTGPPPDMSSEMSPILSPGHWRNRAFEYVDTMSRRISLPRRSLDYPPQPPNGSFTGAAAHGRSSLPPAPGFSSRAPPLVETPPLLVGRQVMQDYSSPSNTTGTALRDDSPNRQLHRESEAAMTLSQMCIYDTRKFART